MLPRLSPLPLGRITEPFDGRDWLFQLKYDGFRALLYVEDGCARLVSRNGNTFAPFGDLCESLTAETPSHSPTRTGALTSTRTPTRTSTPTPSPAPTACADVDGDGGAVAKHPLHPDRVRAVAAGS